jgi:hypothetical protein
MPKERVTLTVDSDVVQKAKALRINISELAEIALRGFTSSTKEVDSEVLYKAYEALFSTMRPLLEKFGTSVRVASVREVDPKTGIDYGDVETFLYHDGSFYVIAMDEVQSEFGDIRQIPVHNFSTPKEILSNLIETLAKAKERDKELMEELERTRLLVEAIAATLQSRKKFTRKPAKTKPRSSK